MWKALSNTVVSALITAHVCAMQSDLNLYNNCIVFSSFSVHLLSAVHIHPDPSGGADPRCCPQQTCLDVGRWNGSQRPGSLYWKWGCVDPRAHRPRRGSAGHGPRQVGTENLIKNYYMNSLYNFSCKDKHIFRATVDCILIKYSLGVVYSAQVLT